MYGQRAVLTVVSVYDYRFMLKGGRSRSFAYKETFLSTALMDPFIPIYAKKGGSVSLVDCHFNKLL